MSEVFIMNKSFCCIGFQHRVAEAGQRGIAVIVVKTTEGVEFRLQSRGIDFEDESKIRPRPGATDMHINVACETGLQYCPYCGTKLQKLIDAAPSAFEDLAEKHKKIRVPGI